MVESNCETALSTSMSYFCLENENMDIITKSEVGLFIDSFFRSVHNILLLDEKDELYQKAVELRHTLHHHQELFGCEMVDIDRC